MRTHKQSEAIAKMDTMAESNGLVSYSDLIGLLGNLKYLNDNDIAAYTLTYKATHKHLDEAVKKLNGPD
jgi:hypothetical protein